MEKHTPKNAVHRRIEKKHKKERRNTKRRKK
jgi:hypothetical protein